MKLILEIDIKGDALAGGGTYQRNEEVARILTVAASKIEVQGARYPEQLERMTGR